MHYIQNIKIKGSNPFLAKNLKKMARLYIFINLLLTKTNNSCFFVLNYLKHLEEGSNFKKKKINIFIKKFFINFLFNLLHFILLKIVSYYWGSAMVGNICTTELLYLIYFFFKFWKEKIVWEHLLYSFLNYFLIIALIPLYVYIEKYLS